MGEAVGVGAGMGVGVSGGVSVGVGVGVTAGAGLAWVDDGKANGTDGPITRLPTGIAMSRGLDRLARAEPFDGAGGVIEIFALGVACAGAVTGNCATAENFISLSSGNRPKWTAAACWSGLKRDNFSRNGAISLAAPGIAPSTTRRAAATSPVSASTNARTRSVAGSRRPSSGSSAASAPTRSRPIARLSASRRRASSASGPASAAR